MSESVLYQFSLYFNKIACVYWRLIQLDALALGATTCRLCSAGTYNDTSCVSVTLILSTALVTMVRHREGIRQLGLRFAHLWPWGCS